MSKADLEKFMTQVSSVSSSDSGVVTSTERSLIDDSDGATKTTMVRTGDDGETVTTTTTTSKVMTSEEAEKTLESWGKPLGLPSPKGSPKRTKETAASEGKSSSGRTRQARASSSSSSPVYMDLAYVPHHGDARYTDMEFFKRVRARYYVFSGVEPSREVFQALLEAKKTWEDKDLGE